MKEQLLSAQDWLEKEDLFNDKVMPKTTFNPLFQGYDLSTIMERYANYKNKQLEVLIMQFRMNLKEASTVKNMEGGEAEFWLEEYDNHFEIKSVKVGEL